MKKLFVSAIILTSLLLNVSAFGQELKKVERFYIGIGISFHKIDSNALGFSGPNDNWNDNKSGKFTGLIMVQDVLPGSPAEKASLKENLVLLEVDGKNVSSMDWLAFETGVIQSIRNGKEGDIVRLKLREVDNQGNAIKEFFVEIPRAKIDRVLWLPPYTAGSTSRGGASGIEAGASYESHWEENKQNGIFTYHYKVTNIGKENLLIQWEVINQAVSCDWNRIHLIYLKHGESKEFILESKEIPAHINGTFTIFEIISARYNNDLKKHDFSGPTDAMWYHSLGSGTAGFIPENCVGEKEN